jgi:predicted ATP-grasp superfamily ATP-dependent carboligase
MPDRLRPVIVTNAKNRVAYNIAKSLGKRGIPVHVADFVSPAMSFASRYVKGHFLYPSPFSKQREFVDCIIANARRLQAEVLIPVLEETFLISKFKDEIEKCVKLAIPSYEQILLVHNKDRLEQLARDNGIQMPKSYSINELRGSRSAIGAIRFPVLVKPKQGGGGWGIRQFESVTTLENQFAEDQYLSRPWDRFLVQEKIGGPTICVAMLFCHGHLRAKIAYRQLRDYPVTGGQATLRVSIRNDSAEMALQRLLEALRWHGICQADFVVDRKTGNPFLIDINPRFWGSIVQGMASGVDFPYLVYQMAMEGDVRASRSYRIGVMTRWVGGDLGAFLSSLRNSRKKAKLTAEFLREGRSVSMYDDFNTMDPMPFIVWIYDVLKRAIKSRSAGPVAHDKLLGIWE